MSCFLLPPCLYKAVSLLCLEGLFVMALWTAQAEKTWENFRICVLTPSSNMPFDWTLGLALEILCGCPQWDSIAQMWAAEASPKDWLRTGLVSLSNLELAGGCEAALSVPFFLPTYLSCTPRLSSTEVFELLTPWYQWELYAYRGNRQQTSVRDPGLRFWICHLAYVDDDKIEKGLLWRNGLVAWNCWDFALIWRLKNGTEEDPVILSELPWYQFSLLNSSCCLARLQWRQWLSKPCSCMLSNPSAGILNPSPSHTKNLHY